MPPLAAATAGKGKCNTAVAILLQCARPLQRLAFMHPCLGGLLPGCVGRPRQPRLPARTTHPPTCADDSNLQERVPLNIQPCHLAINPHQRLLQPGALPLALTTLPPHRCCNAAIAGSAGRPALLFSCRQLVALCLWI